MLGIIAILSPAMGTIMVGLTTWFNSTLTGISDTARSLLYLAISIVLSILGAYALYFRDTTVFANDPFFGTGSPWFGIIFAGLVAVFPPGLLTGWLNLVWGTPPASAQAAELDKPKKLRLWY